MNKDGKQYLHTKTYITLLPSPAGVVWGIFKHPETQEYYIDDVHGRLSAKPKYVSAVEGKGSYVKRNRQLGLTFEKCFRYVFMCYVLYISQIVSTDASALFQTPGPNLLGLIKAGVKFH